MVTVPIHQASSSVPPLSTSVIDITPPKPVSPPIQEPIFTATITTTTTTLLLPPPLQQQSTTEPSLASRVLMLEQRCAALEKQRKLQDKTTHCKRGCTTMCYKTSSPSSLRDRFKRTSEADMERNSLPWNALEASMERANRDEFLTEKDKSRKIHCDDQEPLLPLPDSDLSKKKRHDSNVPIPDDMNISNSEDTDATHLPKIKTKPDWLKPILEEDRPSYPEPDWVIPLNDLPKTENNWANALSSSYQDPDEYKLLRQTSDMSSFINWFYKRIGKKKLSKADLEGPAFKVYQVSVVYGISHWWFKRKEFYITRHSAPSDHGTVRSHMRILSVVSLKTYERYGYTFLKEIVISRADYKEYKILEADFKNLYLNDFEDLYLLRLQ
ncbi:hypothetical protein Tco_1022254, partial [Tanacetum coccineum]